MTVTTPEGRFSPGLDDRIHDRIENRSGRSIPVQVRFIGVATTGRGRLAAGGQESAGTGTFPGSSPGQARPLPGTDPP